MNVPLRQPKSQTLVETIGIKVLSRPAKLLSGESDADRDFWEGFRAHHALLNFEDMHQRQLDAVAEQCAPGVTRVAMLLGRLRGNAKRRSRTTKGQWSPNPHSVIAKRLQERLGELRTQRNADERWKAALLWDRQPVPADVLSAWGLKETACRRKAGESEESFEQRKQKAAKSLRSACEQLVYQGAKVQSETFNAIKRSVEASRKAVVKARKSGMSAKWRRPRARDPQRIGAQNTGPQQLAFVDAETFEAGVGQCIVLRKPGPWWLGKIRLHGGRWVTFKFKGGNWHDIPPEAHLTRAELIRRRDGARWAYSVSLTLEATWPPRDEFASRGVVGLDWGHREFGHSGERGELLAWTWHGSDGAKGRVFLPDRCRVAKDAVDALKARLDTAFLARKSGHRNRYAYRRDLLQRETVTDEERAWLQYERRYERRMNHAANRFQAIRRETYVKAIRDLRRHYRHFVFEDQTGRRMQDLDTDEMTRHRKRSNRDLTARHEFVALCERFGAEKITVSARGTTGECPECGELAEKTDEVLIACPGCGRVRDRDEGAAIIILRRGEELLAKRGESG